MDAHLKLLADASLEVSAAEQGLDERAFHTATDRLDAAALVLADLRAAWPQMRAPERAVVGPAAAQVRERLDAARPRIPRVRAVTAVTAVSDPEEEIEPS